MSHIPKRLFYALQEKTAILNQSINEWLSSNPHERDSFIEQLSISFQNKHHSYYYSCLETAILTGPELFRSVNLFDDLYCERATSILIATIDLLNSVMSVYQIQKVPYGQCLKKPMIFEKWLCEAISETSQKNMDALYKSNEIRDCKICGSDEKTFPFFESINELKDLALHAVEIQECPICKELASFFI